MATVTMPMEMYEELMKKAKDHPLIHRLTQEVKHLKITNQQHLVSKTSAMVREKALKQEVAELKKQLNK
tara:strand:- start:6662 stop:6868 length:207 start_codon:yes stop_codon:yes gene_type:complete